MSIKGQKVLLSTVKHLKNYTTTTNDFTLNKPTCLLKFTYI